MISPEQAYRDLCAECPEAITAVKMLVLAGRTPREIAKMVPSAPAGEIDQAVWVEAAARHLAEHPDLCKED